LGGPSDQATPRASAVNNPFDSANTGLQTPGLSKATSGLTLDAASAKRSQSPLPSGLRTPTPHGLPLGTPGAGQPTTGVTVGDQVGSSGSIGFGLHEPPKMRKAMSKLTEQGNNTVPLDATTAGTSPTPASADTMQVDESSAPMANSQSTQSQSQSHANSQPRGTLAVKLVSARGLAVSHAADANPQPYVVMTFEQNEFVSRPPRATNVASVPFTQAQPTPMTPGNLTRSTSGLAVSTITRAFAEAVGRGKKKDSENSGAKTPRAEEPSGGGWLGKPGPGDPVWKEEVSL
jgi:protein-serine/threonine kinase